MFNGKLYGKAGKSYFPIEETLSDFEQLKRLLEAERADNRNLIEYGIQLRQNNAELIRDRNELLEALKAAAINPNQQIVSETILKYTK
jgi:hypothetical protein